MANKISKLLKRKFTQLCWFLENLYVKSCNGLLLLVLVQLFLLQMTDGKHRLKLVYLRSLHPLGPTTLRFMKFLIVILARHFKQKMFLKLALEVH